MGCLSQNKNRVVKREITVVVRL